MPSPPRATSLTPRLKPAGDGGVPAEQVYFERGLPSVIGGGDGLLGGGSLPGQQSSRCLKECAVGNVAHFRLATLVISRAAAARGLALSASYLARACASSAKASRLFSGVGKLARLSAHRSI